MFENEVDETRLRETILERNTKEELADKLMMHMKLVNASESTLLWANTFKVNWRSLPFIPEDLGFKEHVEKLKGSPKMRVYFRDNISCAKKLDGKWSVMKDGDLKMEFEIKSKFHAFMIFTCLGINIEDGDSTVPDLINKPISEIIKNASGEEE